MRFWVGWFARFHSDGNYVPYQIQTVDRPVVRADGSPVLCVDGRQQKMRCVREVVRHEVVGGLATWMMIAWNIGLVGVTFYPCESLDEAMARYKAPPSPICLT